MFINESEERLEERLPDHFEQRFFRETRLQGGREGGRRTAEAKISGFKEREGYARLV